MSAVAPSLTHQQILPIVRGVSLCILLAALDQTIIVPALPKVAAQLGGGHQIAWIVSAYLLTGTAATPLFGNLSDLYGRRRLLNPALAIFVLASIGCALAQNFGQLVACRAVQGVGGAGLVTIAQIAIADIASPRERGRYQIYMSGMWGIASIAGPVLGGALTDSVTWRAIFWINLPLGLLAYVMSNRALRLLPPHHGGGRRIDYGGAIFLTTGVTVWLVLISGIGHGFGVVSVAAAGLLVAGLVFTALTVWQERRVAAPMLPLHLFTNGTVLAGFGLAATNNACTFGASFLLPLYFQYQQHTNAARSGLFTTPFLLTLVAMTYFSGRLARALGRTRPPMLVALALCVVGLGLLASLGPHSPVPLCILYMCILGAGIGLVQPNITVTIQNAVERRDVGSATSSMLLFRSIGGAFGATLVAAVLLAAGFAAAFGACAVIAVIGLALVFNMRDSVLRG